MTNKKDCVRVEFYSNEMEQKLFGVRDYIKDNSYVTSHDSVNVYNTILGKKYILKYGPDSLDIQVMGAKSEEEEVNDDREF